MPSVMFSCPLCQMSCPVDEVKGQFLSHCPNCARQIDGGGSGPPGSSWYWRKDGQRLGPFTWDQLHQLAASAQLDPSDEVRQRGTPTWVKASQVEGLVLVPASITFACPSCRTSLRCGEAKAGAKVPCPRCGQRLQVPRRTSNDVTLMGELLAGQWFLLRDGQSVGPLTLKQVRQFASEGQLTPADLVLTPGAQRWAPAGTVPGVLPTQQARVPKRSLIDWLLMLGAILALPAWLLASGPWIILVGAIWLLFTIRVVLTGAVADFTGRLHRGGGYRLAGVGLGLFGVAVLIKGGAGLFAPAKPPRPSGVTTQAGAPLAPNEIYASLLRSTVLVADLGDRGGSGTGWIVNRARRQVVTNHHVIAGADRIVVFFPTYREGKLVAEQKAYFDNRFSAVQAHVLDADPVRDLALLELKSVPAECSELVLAATSPQPGDRVHSVGNPDASDALWVYTSGSVRQVYQKQMSFVDQRIDAKLIETSSPINPGDSGGPVVNDKGELVGVTSAFNRKGRLISYCVDVSEVNAFVGRKQRTPEAARPNRLDGRWKVVAAEAGGKAVDADELKDAAIVIEGDKLTMADKGKDGKELTFKIDPSKHPKQIDLTDPKDKDSKPVPCIYSLDGDDLKLCIPLVPPGKKDEAKRPDSFDTKDKPLMTITAKREPS